MLTIKLGLTLFLSCSLLSGVGLREQIAFVLRGQFELFELLG